MKRILLLLVLGGLSLLARPTQAQSGTWTLEFFDNLNLSGFPVATLTSPSINFDWGAGAPVGVRRESVLNDCSEQKGVTEPAVPPAVP